ncbi:nitrogen permease regulator of amino acid transport activity 3-domain-containing protein [Mycena amicta]|nr:nitrogen permease regulator of amino acid transport activity 3-domain-containing protein [Mycena amicta]
MAESSFSTLLAILLVTTSAKGKWPASPVSSPRFSRAKPEASHFDNPWKSARPNDAHNVPINDLPPSEGDLEREWKRPSTLRDRSMSFSSSGSHPSSGRNSPDNQEGGSLRDEYDHLFGYPSEFLANLLCPQRSMCHQKFELVVEDLAFIGHPVSAEDDGGWRFKPEKVKTNDRGRESMNRRAQAEQPDSRPVSSETASPASSASWLQRFHFVMVLDVPDPSSSASGNITKYFDIIYEQIAFPVAAVLFQEQVLYNFVEEECDRLGSLKDTCSKQGDDFVAYMNQALAASSIAPAMKTLFEALKSSSVAYISIHNLPLELQLPPYLDTLLHSEDDDNEPLSPSDDSDTQTWGQEMSFGYRLPSLTAWKSLLLLDDGPEGVDPYANLRQSTGDRSLVEGLLRFLETSTVTLSLADMASLLDWDLETQIFPTVRWLVHHRRAKIVDTVHPGLKTIFRLPAKFSSPLAQLTKDFDKEFSALGVPSLPELLAKISTSKEGDTHFFASVVTNKDSIPLYLEVVLWMLKRDMLITLHLRIRIVATVRLKESVRFAKGRIRDKKGGARKGHSKLRIQLDADADHSPPAASCPSKSPKGGQRYTRLPSVGGSRNSRLSELILQDDSGESDERRREDDTTDTQDESEEENESSIIDDPGRATPLQRRWLSAMSEDKDPALVRHFEQINQYFDGKRTDDEILYRADMSRRELREVLHAYNEYLLTFLHPS